ncbi:hypothetical protein V1503_24705 [Bacillus sp. SCS-151]|uniref:hypothetical protein n=1 Tax=Nanhaiella sioensis TaxID=3115293 RepID=UPI00397B96F5
MENGKLPESVLKNEAVHKLSNIKNVDHYLATQEVVIKSLLQVKELNNVVSIHPYTHPFHLEGDDKQYVIPDWILKKK